MKYQIYFIIFTATIFFNGCVSNKNVGVLKASQENHSNTGTKVESSEESFYIYKSMGMKAARHKHFSMALNYFLKAEKIKPNDAEILRLIGDSLGQLSRYKEATEYFEKSVKINPRDFRAYGLLGVINQEIKNYDRAVFYFKKVLALKAQDKYAIARLAKSFFELKKYDESIKYMDMFKDAIAQDAPELLTEIERRKIKGTLENFKHFQTIIDIEKQSAAKN